jgi:hypothetical protein
MSIIVTWVATKEDPNVKDMAMITGNKLLKHKYTGDYC